MKLLNIAKSYTKKIDILDLVFLKLCLFSSGVMIGTSIPKKKSKSAFKFSFFIFLITYCTLMTRFITVLVKEKED